MRKNQIRPDYKWVMVAICFLMVMISLGFGNSTKGLFPDEIAKDFDYWTENMDQLRPPQAAPDDYELETAQREQRKAEQRQRSAENRREASRQKKQAERRARAEGIQRRTTSRKGRKGRK